MSFHRKNYWDKLRTIPLPQNDAELAVVSEWWFGVPLSLRNLNICGNGGAYEVDQDYDSYHGNEFAFSKGSTEGYDHSGAFWDVVLGRLGCGGIARASYGQFNIRGHRSLVRLRKWVHSRRSGQVCSLRAPFVRLAERCRVRREQTELV